MFKASRNGVRLMKLLCCYCKNLTLYLSVYIFSTYNFILQSPDLVTKYYSTISNWQGDFILPIQQHEIALPSYNQWQFFLAQSQPLLTPFFFR